ncbi:MAG: SDR family oxidoreductase [Betaproteobacteria bacterium]|nr:MAG: SDR family oxidoreductase [Betaproteobacteria bacterium]
MAGVIVITGSSRGIGAATACLAARQGYDVCVNYIRDAAAAEEVAGKVRAAGRRAIAVQANVGNEEEIERLFKAVDRELGRLTVLVNNAAVVGQSRRRVETLRAQAVNALLAANVTGAIVCAREAILRMSTKHGGAGGAIVNVSSASSRIGAPNLWVDYAASKGAIDSFTIGLAQEVAGEGIRVNAVRPGLIDTDIHAATGMPDRVARAEKMIPMKRAGAAEEVAESILWLASPAASYVSGAILDVAGAVR